MLSIGIGGGGDVVGALATADLAPAVPTEASAQALRCEHGVGTIRGGRRSVELSPIGAVSFYYDPEAAVSSAARLADAVTDATSLEEAEAILAARGITSELPFERRVYAG